jgi:hypothetical protein
LPLFVPLSRLLLPLSLPSLPSLHVDLHRFVSALLLHALHSLLTLLGLMLILLQLMLFVPRRLKPHLCFLE